MLRKTNYFPRAVTILLIVIFLGFLIGCGTGGLTSGTPASTGTTTGTGTGTGTSDTGGAGTTQTAVVIKLTADPVSIKSGNLETSTITATVLDANRAAVKNIKVTFSVTDAHRPDDTPGNGGQMSDVSALTDATGKAQITFSSGTVDPSVQVVSITGTAPGIATPASERTVPVTITGSTLTMSTDKTNITNDGNVAATLTVTAKDGSGAVIFNTPITFKVSPDGGATVTDISGDGKTDPLGRIFATIKGTPAGSAAGSVTVTAAGLGTSATQKYTVSAVGSLLAITSPTVDPKSLNRNVPLTTKVPLTVTVNAAGVTTVRFATTLGTFDGLGQVVDKNIPVAPNTFSASFQSSRAGLATVEVSEVRPPNDPCSTEKPCKSDSLGVVISAPANDAAQITLQSNLSSVAPSAGDTLNTADLTATVRTSVISGGQVVGNAAVAFSILNPTGGGESVSPVTVFTDGQGRAKTTFQSGTLSSDSNGVTVQASIVGVSANPATTSIVIGGTPGSVTIGRGSQVAIPNATTYSLPMSVTVADANGNAVQGRFVSLKLWPSQYSSGIWYDSDPDPSAAKFVPYVTNTVDNEDTNKDLYKNVGEDVNLNGVLDPPNSAAGTVPATVKTDQFGVGNFSITYPKQSAVWTVAEIRASVEVSGTETSSVMTFRLPAERGEAESGVLPDSSHPIELTATSGGQLTRPFLLPPFSSDATYSTKLNSASAVVVTTKAPVPPATVGAVIAEYTFTAPAVAAGTRFNDTIYVQDPALGTWLVPVQIIIQ